jgi:hypothetical protein
MYAPPAERQGQPMSATNAALPSFALLPADLVPESEERSLLASRAFWLGGIASVLVWTGMALAITRIL